MPGLRSEVEAGLGLVARAIEGSVPQTHHSDIMDGLAKLQFYGKLNLFLSVLTLALLIVHLHGLSRTHESVERVARQVATTLNLGGQDVEDAVQYCVQNAILAEAPSTGEQEGTAQASTSAPTSESSKRGGKKG